MTGHRAAYARRYRADHPDYTAAMAQRSKARHRALARLAKRYPADMELLFAQEHAALRNAGSDR